MSQQSPPNNLVEENIVEPSNEVGKDKHLEKPSDDPDNKKSKHHSTDFEDPNPDSESNGPDNSDPTQKKSQIMFINNRWISTLVKPILDSSSNTLDIPFNRDELKAMKERNLI